MKTEGIWYYIGSDGRPRAFLVKIHVSGEFFTTVEIIGVLTPNDDEAKAEVGEMYAAANGDVYRPIKV